MTTSGDGLTQPSTIWIAIVDDHRIVRSGLRLLIERAEATLVVAEAGTAEEAVAAATREQPDVILLDLDLGRDSGLTCLPRLREAAPSARVLVLTGIRDTDVHQQAIRLGAVGVLVKDKAPELLIRAIERVHAGEIWLDRTTTTAMLAELAGPRKMSPRDPEQEKVATLTPREREVISLVTKGLRNKQIGERLYISEATVRHHLTSIFAKLEVPDRMALTIYAFRHGLAQAGD
jgi:DNA-binding NarL/FixJ family response regulator